MIAAGLCTMGGCFAQAESGHAENSYFPAAYVRVPSYSSGGSFGLYELYSLPPLPLADLYACTRQVHRGGDILDIVIRQGGHNGTGMYICYSDSHGLLELQTYSTRGPVYSTARYLSFPYTAEIIMDASGAHAPVYQLSTEPCAWRDAVADNFVRVLDIRNGTKDFCFSYGFVGRKWLVLAMKSCDGSLAVFDFEAKTLVEL